ncbi:MAG: hypothetical protein KF833_14205 [Verrucomicrobiae bacterium]|nr:hypothetical protein [Verrucomicrobiae bacterium]
MKPFPGNRPHRPFAALLALLAAAWFLAGCATNEERLSERPWNTPRSWETGLPTGMTEERR